MYIKIKSNEVKKYSLYYLFYLLRTTLRHYRNNENVLYTVD